MSQIRAFEAKGHAVSQIRDFEAKGQAVSRIRAFEAKRGVWLVVGGECVVIGPRSVPNYGYLGE